MRKIIILANSPLFFKQHLFSLLDNYKSNTKIYLITSFKKKYQIKIPNIIYIPIIIKRNPSIKDIFSLITFSYLRFIIRPDISLSFTPKAGFLNAITFFLPGKTIHYFTGQRWVTFEGLKKKFYMYIDKFIINVSKEVYCDSLSQSNFISKHLNSKSPKVINHGSICGVDTNLFIPKKRKLLTFKNNKDEQKKFLEFKLFLKNPNLKEDYFVFGYVGRINRDKGIITLLKAFKKHLKRFPNNKLVLIGPIEMPNKDLKIIYENSRSLLHIDYTNFIHYYYPHLKAIVLPSLREGFGSVVIEAGACKVPCISTKVSGPIDFIEHNINGYFIKKKSEKDLLKTLNYFAENQDKITKFGENAYKLVNKKYKKSFVKKKFLDEFGL